MRTVHGARVLAAGTAILAVAGASLVYGAAPKFLKASASAPKSVAPGSQFTVSTNVAIDRPFHIQANPSKDGYIATELEVGPLRGFKLDKVVYPRPSTAVSGGERLPVFEGKVVIKADVTVDKSTKPGKYLLPITIKYQGCDQTRCFPPTTVNTKAAVTVSPGGN